MDAPLTVYIHTNIGYKGIRAIPIIGILKDNSSIETHIHFNSSGGDVFEGIAIFNAIKSHKSKTVSYIDQLAAGVSFIIALASDEIVMDSEALIMMCNPYFIEHENDNDANTINKKVIEKIVDSFVRIYSTRSNRTEAQIIKMMDVETFLTADEAYGYGFIDRIG